jgi:hypothetical protein
VRRFLYEDEMAKTLIEVDLLRQLLAFVAQIVDGNLCSKLERPARPTVYISKWWRLNEKKYIKYNISMQRQHIRRSRSIYRKST